MLKYLAAITERLTGLKNGMEKNPEKWTNQPVTSALVQAKIDELEALSKADTSLKNQITENQSKAHSAQIEADKFADKVESIAIGLEDRIQDNLNPYGIKLRKSPTKKTAPTLPLHIALMDDTDGEGIIASTNVDQDADMYEWMKGLATDATKLDSLPELKFFKTTKKTTFVDDEVPKGVRVFYKVRAVNTAGNGPWSEAVSRVQ